ncbi:MAG: sugar ABC transporter permease [Aquamicrobium sp.]|uniref:carbohydrate ABC transporter permease n=1 Tax=Mesorhizobium TaxID=68287 RepID=UPI0010129A44|nr:MULTISPECIES: sugar ABC transporter permease [Mesorhizobium]MBR2688404.1 sugar ABC transporter permease [Aquamicrobium sp.]QAZ42342.1 ABC transporter permease [Mesorhizobium sp. Pch-S]
MKTRLERREHLSGLLFVAPLIAVLVLVAGWPLARTLYFSLTDAYLDDSANHVLVGFDNFVEVAGDPVWWRAVRNTAIFTTISVAIETVLGLAIALLLHGAIPGRGLVRAAILVPWAMPVVVSTKIWEWMLNDQFGVVNRAIVGLGLADHGVAWVANGSLLLGVVIFIDVWMTTPFMVLLILAGLQILPEEIFEAAEVDGIPWWKRLWSITLPLLAPTIGVAVLFRVLDALRMFDLAYVLAGANVNAMTMSIYARDRLINNQELGVGSAASTMVFLLIAFVAIFIVGAMRLDRSGAADR